MPHALSPENSDEFQVDDFSNPVLSFEQLQDITTRELEPGEKADDAQDFEDISDNDLADDEDEIRATTELPSTTTENRAAANGALSSRHTDGQQNGHGGDEIEDLFGDDSGMHQGDGGLKKSPVANRHAPPVSQSQEYSNGADQRGERLASSEPGDEAVQDAYPDLDDAADADDVQWQEQLKLFAAARSKQQSGRIQEQEEDTPMLDAAETPREIFQLIWPQFEAHKPPKFGQMIPSKRAYYMGKTPLKPPKPIQANKVTLDLAQDQERAFRLHGSSGKESDTNQLDTGRRGITRTDQSKGHQRQEALKDGDSSRKKNGLGGITLEEMAILCDDWDVSSLAGHKRKLDDTDGDDFSHFGIKRTRGAVQFPDLTIPEHEMFSFENPEEVTAKVAAEVRLDLNDPYLLVDLQQSKKVSQARRLGTDFRRDVSGSLTKNITKRFNISNDEAYELLKENHQHKIRSNLSSVAVDHSMPALKLQYPFYKVTLSPREARSFHRPILQVKGGDVALFKPNRVIKRKHQKGKDAKALYPTADSLSMGDNSSSMLLEYSEEYPTMLSNFGMASRMINYYRRKDMEDNLRPKADIGETQVLLPQDKSPFSIFGHIESGESILTFHNSMYRAPVFSQGVKPSDFLVVRNATGMRGSTWHIRRLEHLYVVGQEFPLVEVPGTHSRKVTETAKRRLKALSYRIHGHSQTEKSRGPLLSNDTIREHLPGSDVAQNRGKMREFMQYDKESSLWIPKSGDAVPDSDTIRAWIRPEDICLLDSMQVGARHLLDAGYNRQAEESGDEEEEEGKVSQSVEQQLAPWHTTKNFLNACQGKAMLQLHGEGDPSGRGEAFSFIKTSMKGGFKALGESVEDRLDAKRMKELGGHSYNVARQQKVYEETIRRIWDAQKMSLSSTIEHSDVEMDVDDEAEAMYNRGDVSTPTFTGRRDDESMSQMSRNSFSAMTGKVLRITRTSRDRAGNQIVGAQDVITDPRVAMAYERRKREIGEAKKRYAQRVAAQRERESNEAISLDDIGKTGDAEQDAKGRKQLEKELARLQRNQERRIAREKAKGMHGESPSAASPGSPGASNPPPPKTGGTQRRCQNCGQIGHIKTNKKCCDYPLFDGDDLYHYHLPQFNH